jgi:alkaline phosphatase D
LEVALLRQGLSKRGQGEVRGTNVTVDTDTGEWSVHDFDTMLLKWALEYKGGA